MHETNQGIKNYCEEITLDHGNWYLALEFGFVFKNSLCEQTRLSALAVTTARPLRMHLLPLIESWQIVHRLALSDTSAKRLCFSGIRILFKAERTKPSLSSTHLLKPLSVPLCARSLHRDLWLATESCYCVLVSLEISQCQDLGETGNNNRLRGFRQFDLHLLNEWPDFKRNLTLTQFWAYFSRIVFISGIQTHLDDIQML